MSKKKKKSGARFLGVVILMVICASVGYMAGKRGERDNITTAQPKESISIEETIEPVENPEEKEEAEEVTEPAPKEEIVKYITRFDKSAADASWTEAAVCNTDITGDGNDEKITVYTSAQKDGNEFLWDDRNSWVAEVETVSGDYYTLASEKINSGNMYIEVMEINSEKVISVITTGVAGVKINNYTYTPSGFIETSVCKGAAENLIHSSVPFYE